MHSAIPPRRWHFYTRLANTSRVSAGCVATTSLGKTTQRRIVVAVVLSALVFSTYARVARHAFVNYDDPDYVTANQHVQQGLTWNGIAWAFSNTHGEKTYWHPLTWVSHMLDCQLFGLNPAGHHLVNVGWHLANTLLLFFVLSRLTRSQWRSAAVAALFAVHPLQVDTVAWVTERKNLLSTFFLLLTLLGYGRYAAEPRPRRYFAVAAAFALGLMCKPAIVPLPCLLLLLDFWPLRRIGNAPAQTGQTPARNAGGGDEHPFPPVTPKKAVMEKLPLLGLALVSSLITIQAHQGLGMIDPGAQLSFTHRVENAVVSYVRYLQKAVWPSKLAVLYPHPGAWPQWEVIACAVVILAITTIAVRQRREKPYLFTGWFWFVGMLVPAIGVVQVGAQAMADRFAYVPLIGHFIAAVWVAADLAARFNSSAIVPAAAGATAVAACVAITSVQLGYWNNSITLMEHTVAVTHNNFMAHHDLGVALTEERRYDAALNEFAEALKIRTNALSLYEIGRVYELEHRTNEAVAEYQRAADVDPKWLNARKRAAFLLSESLQTDAALGQYSQILRSNPDDPETQTRVAMLLAFEGRTVEAVAHYLDALRADRRYVPALNNLDWLRATQTNAAVRNGPEAISLAQSACALTQWRQPTTIATLAAAYAEAGNFGEAARVAQQAITATKAADPTADVRELEKMMNEFVAGQPHRAIR